MTVGFPWSAVGITMPSLLTWITLLVLWEVDLFQKVSHDTRKFLLALYYKEYSSRGRNVQYTLE